MKQTKKSKKSKQKFVSIKAASYIGVFALASVGLIAALVSWRLSDIVLRPENSPAVLLPTQAPPVSTPAPVPAALPPVAAETVATVEAPEPSATPVFQQPEPLRLILPVEGEVLTPFSVDKLLRSKTMGDWRTHNGIDLKADSGTAVKAAAAGVVEQAYQDALMGYTIVISHENNYRTLYQNLASVEMVSVGQTVTGGQVIAAAGNSAAAELLEASHIHFALKQGDSYQNPADLIESGS